MLRFKTGGNQPQPNFLTERKVKDLKPLKIKDRKVPLALKIVLGVFIFMMLIIVLLSYKIALVSKDVFQPDEKTSIVDQIKNLVIDDNKLIDGEEDGRTNIVLMGMGGEGHQGALLTDTIIIASIKHNGDKPPEVALISIPRDLAVPFRGSRYLKINSIYTYGTLDNDDNNPGGKVLSDFLGTMTGLDMHYYVRVDFEGFVRMIDSIGGITVDVKNSFYDSQYPTTNFGYQTIRFTKGETELDGDLALKYARSRHGIVTDGYESEGSDFARARRQQQILTATKDKTFSISTAINLKTINELLNVLGDHVRTNMEPWEMISMAEIFRELDNDKVISRVIDYESGLLGSMSGDDGASLLVASDSTFGEIKDFCKNIFDLDEIEKLREQRKDTKIAILNGTEISGLASKNATKLSRMDYDVIYKGNTQEPDYEKAVIYDLTNGKKPDILKDLSGLYGANSSLVSFDSESILKKPILYLDQTDFIVILGEDSKN